MSQFFLEPNQFSYLNVNPQYIHASGSRYHVEQPLVRLNISLDTEIEIAERVVNDVLTLFGDIGGFSSFILTFFGLLVGSIPLNLFKINATAALFRTNLTKPKDKKATERADLAWFRATKRP